MLNQFTAWVARWQKSSSPIIGRFIRSNGRVIKRHHDRWRSDGGWSITDVHFDVVFVSDSRILCGTQAGDMRSRDVWKALKWVPGNWVLETIDWTRLTSPGRCRHHWRRGSNEREITFSDFRGGGSFQRGFNRGSIRGQTGRYGSGRSFTKPQGETDAYCMDVAPFNIFENQIIPVGLHNLSKNFKPNLTTTRVFSLGTKFIPVWKQMKVQNPFAKFEDFRRRMSNKVYFTETTPCQK